MEWERREKRGERNVECERANVRNESETTNESVKEKERNRMVYSENKRNAKGERMRELKESELVGEKEERR